MIFTALAGRMCCRCFNLNRLNFLRIYGVFSHLLKVLSLTPAAFANSDLVIALILIKSFSILHLKRFRVQLAINAVMVSILGNK